MMTGPRTITFVDGPAEGKQFTFSQSETPIDVAEEIEQLTGCRYLICGTVAVHFGPIP